MAKQVRPPQHQTRQPGVETDMHPTPHSNPRHHPSSKLENKVCLITGGDSGIGRAVALLFAQAGANLAIVYLNEHDDAATTKKEVEATGRRCELIPGDIGDESFCKTCIDRTISNFGHLDCLVNNAAEQHPQDSLVDITAQQLESTFRTNIFSFFYLTKYALPHLRHGSTIINTTSVTAYRGSPHLLDYSATKGAIVSFTRSLALQLAKQGIRVNGVAPGPIWTPLIPSTFSSSHTAEFGSDVPLGRAGEPNEVAPSYLFLASEDSSYMTGQILHPNGGEIING